MTLYESKAYRELMKSEVQRLETESFKEKRVLITGGTGMVGSMIADILLYADELLELDIKVCVTTRSRDKAIKRFEGCPCQNKLMIAEWDAADIRPGALQEALRKAVQKDNGDDKAGAAVSAERFDYYIHCASTTHPKAYASNPIDTIAANVFGLQTLLEAAAESNGSRLAFLSSVEVYGENKTGEGDFAEKDMGYIDCNTLRAGYPEAKRVGEALCMAYAEEKGADTVIPRLARTYGPTLLSSDTKALSQFIKKALCKEDIVLKSSGTQTYSYCFSADAASAVLYLLAKGKSNEAVNVLSPGSDISLKALSEKLAGLSGTKVVFELPEEEEKKGYSTATRATLSGGLLESRGFKSRYMIDEGLEITMEIYRETGGYIV